MRDSLGTYLDQIGRYPLLTASQEIQLSRQIRLMVDLREQKKKSYTKDEQRTMKIGQRAKDKLMRHNLRLVVYVARRFFNRGKYESMDMCDFVQEGALGLERACEMFDGTKGYKFSTYAYWWIKQSLRRAADNKCRIIRLPVHASEKILEIRRFTEKCRQETGKSPTIAEISKHIKMSEEWVKLLNHRVLETASLDIAIGKEGESSLVMLIPDPSTLDEDARYEDIDNFDLHSFVFDAMNCLSPRERQIITMRYGLDSDFKIRTLADIGEELGVCRERSRQLLVRATRKLRAHTYRLAKQHPQCTDDPTFTRMRVAA